MGIFIICLLAIAVQTTLLKAPLDERLSAWVGQTIDSCSPSDSTLAFRTWDQWDLLVDLHTLPIGILALFSLFVAYMQLKRMTPKQSEHMARVG
jgi:hypothetical protein